MNKEQQKQHLIDMMQKDEELGLYDIFNDEKRQGVKELIDTHKQHNMISDWLEQNRNPEIDKQVEKELEFLSEQRLEKYSERFDNDKSEIGNSETWGKRVVKQFKKK